MSQPPLALFGTSADPPTAGHRALLAGLAQHYGQVATWASDNPGKRHGAPLVLRARLLSALVQGLAEGLGISEAITSPTFALAQHYPQGEPQLVHLDLYRLEQPASADELFLQEEEEARSTGALMAVEWPERLGLDLAEAWHLELRHQDEGRLAQLTSPKKAST